MLVVPGAGDEFAGFGSDGHRLFHRIGGTLPVVEEAGLVVSAEFHIVHVRPLACHPFAVDGAVVVGIGIQEDAAHDVFTALRSGELCLRGTETAECGVTAQCQQEGGAGVQAYQIGVLLQNQRLFHHIPALWDVDVGILFHRLQEDLCVIAETVSFGT